MQALKGGTGTRNADDRAYPPETLDVPGGTFDFRVSGNAIEGDPLPRAVDVQFPWEDSPRRSHHQVMEMSTLLVDRYPVTNADYREFLLESGWTPPGWQLNRLKISCSTILYPAVNL